MAENTIDVQVRVDTSALQRGVQEVGNFSTQVRQELQSITQQAPAIADPKTTQQVKQLGTEIDQVRKKASEWQKVTQTLGTSFNKSLRGMLEGTMTLQQGIESIFRSVYTAIVDTLFKMVEQWVVQHVVMAGISKITGATQIGSAAAEAGANAYAATAIIPFVGPELAPAAASTAYAGALSFGALNMASAAGGWGIVPQDQLAMVHKNEMVLPAALAERVRNMSGGPSLTVNMGGNTINTHDPEGFARSFDKAFVSLVRKHIRKGTFVRV